MTSLQRHGRKGWKLHVAGQVHEVPTSAEALERFADAIAYPSIIVGDVARITSPRPTPREPIITDEESR